MPDQHRGVSILNSAVVLQMAETVTHGCGMDIVAQQHFSVESECSDSSRTFKGFACCHGEDAPYYTGHSPGQLAADPHVKLTI